MKNKKILRHPKDDEILQLKKIWCEGFPEDKEFYCNFFFENYYDKEKCLVIVNEKEIEFAGYQMKCYYKDDKNKKYDFIYLYGLSTSMKYRHQGNLRYYLDNVESFYKNISGIILKSEDNLTGMYEKLGLKQKSHFNVYNINVEKSENNTLEMKICDYATYKKLRIEYLDKMPKAIYWMPKEDEYMFKMTSVDGKILKCKKNNRIIYVVTIKNKEIITIRETNANVDEIELLLKSVSKYYNEEKIELYSFKNIENLDSTVEKKDIIYGHYRLLDDSVEIKDAYMNMFGD